MKKKIIYKNLILPLSIIISSIIFGAFLYKIQIAKQESIEKQQNKELELKQQAINTENERIDREQQDLKICMGVAIDKKEWLIDQGILFYLARGSKISEEEYLNNSRDTIIKDCMLIKGYAGY